MGTKNKKLRLEDVINVEVCEKMSELDPNIEGKLTLTEPQVKEVISMLRNFGLEDSVINLLHGRDLDKDPVKFADLNLITKH